MDLAVLRTELGESRYAGLSDSDAAAALNAAGDSRVPRGIIRKDEFVNLVVQPFLAIKALQEGTLREKWLDRLDLLHEVTEVNASSGTVLAFLQELASDGLIQTGEIEQIATREATRAEAVLGPGTVVSAEDVARALRGGA